MTRKKNKTNANNSTYGQAIKFKLNRLKENISNVRCTKQNDKKKADVDSKNKPTRRRICFSTTRTFL